MFASEATLEVNYLSAIDVIQILRGSISWDNFQACTGLYPAPVIWVVLNNGLVKNSQEKVIKGDTVKQIRSVFDDN